MNPRYRFIRTIASGGMAIVYEAVALGERGFERKVAIKRVRPDFAHEPAMQRMFFDEARIASHLHHGNIVDVIDYGVVDESEFLVMEYVDGVDSRKATRRGTALGQPLPDALGLHIASEVASALHYAHNRCGPDGERAFFHHDFRRG